MKPLSVALLILIPMGCSRDESEPWKVPHLDDETRLVRVKANPEEYVGKTFIICGGLQISDYYNYSYLYAEDARFSLRFTEAGETNHDHGFYNCYLYLSKKRGKPIVDTLVKFAEESNVQNFHKLARLQVTIDPTFYARDKQWDMMEVLDVQFPEKDRKGWQPWVLASGPE